MDDASLGRGGYAARQDRGAFGGGEPSYSNAAVL